MTNLKEGQRIDVYEASSWTIEAFPDLQNSQMAKYPSVSSPFDINLCDRGFFKAEVQKCGYYLKVKSLKGGSSE